MSLIGFVALAGLLLAYANGANDNFKGVATLFGSGTTEYRGALVWATLTTLAGSFTALFLARGLLVAFSGKGLLPVDIIADPSFAAAVGFAAGATVLLATRLGFPVSTTHALIGGLVGAGLVSASEALDWGRLGDKFLLPLLVSPILAITMATLLYPLFRNMRHRLGISHEACVCIGEELVARVPGSPGKAIALQAVPGLSIDDEAICRVRYQGRVIGVAVDRVFNRLHYLSAGAVCFARGLNDTPKIAAILLAGSAVTPNLAIVAVGGLMAVGGLASARRVADTMSLRISEMSPGQGLTANLITAGLVIGASNIGVPVSTTHVSCGSLFGIGAITKQAHWRTIAQIALAWLITLPVGAALGAVVMAMHSL